MSRSPSIAIKATIVVSTKNRKDDLRNTLTSCLEQSGAVETIVIDDGSSDGTSEMLASEFPSLTVIRHHQSTGYIVARNEGAMQAAGEIIVSIDDDAVFTTSNVIQQTIAEFHDPRVGAVAIPYADINRDGVERQRTPDASRVFVTDRFIGTAHAIRRDVFLQLDGYREFFFHQGEESDFCIRMLDAGSFVRLGNSDRIDHFESPKRDTQRMDLYGRRNDILFAVLNVPFVCLVPHLLGVTLKGLWFGMKIGRPVRMARGLLFGYFSAFRYCMHRRPVSLKGYGLFRRLRKEGVVELNRLP
jgi:GT2 family glycosyltransferase